MSQRMRDWNELDGEKQLVRQGEAHRKERSVIRNADRVGGREITDEERVL